MSQALYRKWRPAHWDQVIGQPHIVQTLRNAISAELVAHAYLFAGPRGTGKTTTARLLAKAVNCLDANLAGRPCNRCAHCQAVNQGRFLDLIEIDAASNTSVEDVRELRDKINFSPNQGRYKVYIVDEVHMLSTAAFNALLKTLEEPPSHAIFILATTEAHKIPATVLSRCQRHEFRRIPLGEIIANLKILAEGEGIQVDDDALTLVARQATGAMRDAISLLDQLASSGERITLDMAQDVLGTATSQAVLEVMEAMLVRQSAPGLEAIHRALDGGSDPRQFARQIVDYLRSLLLVAMGNAAQVDATAESRAQMARHSQALPVSELLRLVQVFNQAGIEMRASWQPAFPLEMAFIEAINPPGAAPETKPPAPTKGGTGSRLPAREPAGEGRAEPGAQRLTPPAGNLPAATLEDLVEAISAPDTSSGADETSATDDSAARRLHESWKMILAQLRKRDDRVYGLMNSCKVYHLKNSVLTLGMSSEVLKAQIERPANLEGIREVVSQALGMDIVVRVKVAGGKRTAPPDEVDSDGMVATALRDLGGEIVDIK